MAKCYHPAGYFLMSEAHVCLITRRRNPSQGGQISWALPSEERCICDKILIAPDKIHLTGSSTSCEFHKSNTTWWYTDVSFSTIDPDDWLLKYRAQYRRCNETSFSFEGKKQS